MRNLPKLDDLVNGDWFYAYLEATPYLCARSLYLLHKQLSSKVIMRRDWENELGTII